MQTTDGDMTIDATELQRIDGMSVVVIRAALERFLWRRPSNQAWIKRPAHEGTRALFEHLLGPLPDRVEFYGANPPAKSHRNVLVAARRVHDVVALGEALEALVAAEERISRQGLVRPGALLLEAFGCFVENGIRHGQDSDVDVICLASFTQSEDLQVAVFDGGSSVAQAPDVELRLRSHPEKMHGGYQGVMTSCSYPSTLHLMAGCAMLRQRRRTVIYNKAGHLAGYLAVLDIHL